MRKDISFGLSKIGVNSIFSLSSCPVKQNGLLLSSYVWFRTSRRGAAKVFSLAFYSSLFGQGLNDALVHQESGPQLRFLGGLGEVRLYSRILYNSLVGALRFWFEELELVGLGYRLTIKGSTVRFRLGFSHVFIFPIPNGVFLIKRKKRVLVYSTNKGLLTFFVSCLLRLRKMSAYKVKGIKKKAQIFNLKPGKKRAK